MSEVLVTGATGLQGGATSRALRSAGEPVRAMVRDRDSAAALALAENGCSVVQADFDDLDSVRNAMNGVDRIFLVLPLGRPADEERWGRSLIDAASEAGVRHLVYSAALDTHRETGIGHFDSKFRLRQYLAKSDVPHTVLAPGGFMENLLFEKTWQGLPRGRLVTPWHADTRQTLVAVDDIGRFAAACLREQAIPSGAVYPVYTECLNAGEQAEIIGELLGRRVEARKLPDLLIRLFLGRDLYRMFRYYNRSNPTPPPENTVFLDRVERPISFRRWCEDRLGD